MSAERVAREFHETYERLAPDFDYKTRTESAKSWEEVPEANKSLMIEVVKELINREIITVSRIQEETLF